MLFPPRILEAIADGTVDLAFRRWERPRVRPGGRQRTAIGVIGFDSVEQVERNELATEDARRAGFASLDELLRFVDRRPGRTTYRIGLRLIGPDPRAALRETLPDDGELGEIEGRLARLDRSSRRGPWTWAVLAAIRDHPGIPAAELAEAFGRERLAFKADVRKLKELGLTESLRPGYRLSPRGRAVIDRESPPTDDSRRRARASRPA
jgi:DNA-binding transcriptional ArsR family regulator